MNATALNAASIQATGQAGVAAGTGVQGAGTGPSAGFEALLAALFSTGGTAATPATAGTSGSSDTPSDETVPTGDDLAANPELAFADLSYGAANANLLAGVIAVQTPISSIIPTSGQATATGGTAEAPRAFAPTLAAAGTLGGPALTPARTNDGDVSVPEPGSGSPVEGSGKAGLPGPSLLSDGAEQTSPNLTAALARGPAASIPDQPPVPRAGTQAPTPAPEPSAAETIPAPSGATPAAAEVSIQTAGLQGRLEPPTPVARSARAERAKVSSEAAPASAATTSPTTAAPNLVKPVQAHSATTSDHTDADEHAISDTIVTPDSPEGLLQGESRVAAQGLASATPGGHVVRGSPETVATLAAQIIKKLESQSTRFDLELNPGGLGKVDVRIDIGAHGRITAAMTFDNPQAASDLKARANELQRAMEQAGFDMSGGMSFDVAGDRGQQPRQAWQEQTDNNGQGFRGQAFRAALDTAGAATDAAINGALRLRRGVNAGLDLRI